MELETVKQIVSGIIKRFNETLSIEETAKDFKEIIKKVNDDRIKKEIQDKKIQKSSYNDYVFKTCFEVVLNVFDVSDYQLKSKSRKRELVDPRACYAIVCTDIIGVESGSKSSFMCKLINRDHSMIHHYWTNRETYEKDSDWLDKYDRAYGIVETLTNEKKIELGLTKEKLLKVV